MVQSAIVAAAPDCTVILSLNVTFDVASRAKVESTPVTVMPPIEPDAVAMLRLLKSSPPGQNVTAA